jgi:hypothetical protein
MNGAEALIRTAAACGVELCFANPGTTEMHLVAALDAAPGVRAVLGLFEGVVTGAADGYARLAGKPALTLLHLGPGFANGIANLHNARRAHSPIVNLIGDQATWHLAADAPLTSDIESLARPVSRWVRKSATAAALPGDLADAVAAARNGAGGVATLIVPADCAWSDAPVTTQSLPDYEIQLRGRFLFDDVPMIAAHPLVFGVADVPKTALSDERVSLSLGTANVSSGNPVHPKNYLSWLVETCPYCDNLFGDGFWIGFADSGLDGGRTQPLAQRRSEFTAVDAAHDRVVLPPRRDDAASVWKPTDAGTRKANKSETKPPASIRSSER